MTQEPRVSVVCATFRRPGSAARLLAALERQDLDEPFEVVVSDDGSGPSSVAALREAVAASSLPVVLLEHERNRGPGAARNDGWRAARGELVAFTDDDCQPVPAWLREGVAAMQQGEVVAVGAVEPDPAQADALGPWSRTLHVKNARFFQTANAFYRRADLEQVGGFDESFVRGGEDTDLGLRVLSLGRRSVFVPGALVHHDVRAGTVWALARERATKWVDLPLVLRKHPHLREENLYKRVFWKRSHPPVIVALVGLAVLPLGAARRSAGVAGLLLLAPWFVDRGLWHPPARAPKQRVRLMPGTFLVDAAEVVSCVRGSVKHRTLLL